MKRIISLILSICIMSSFLAILAIGVEGANNVSASTIVNNAKSLIDKYPYVWGGESPEEGGFDCSGFVWYVYNKMSGVDISLSQAGRSKAALTSAGTKINGISNFLPGDIVQFDYPHVAIYIGDNTIIEAQKSGTRIKYRTINSYSQVAYAIRLSSITQGSASNATTPTPVSTPTTIPTPSIPADLSLSTSTIYLDYPNSSSQTITVSGTGDLPSKYQFDIEVGSNVFFSWGTPSNNSASLTLSANQYSSSTTATIYLKDSNGKCLSSRQLNINVTQSVVQEYVKISFDSMGSSTEFATQTVEKYGTVITPDRAPKRTGYTFLGWNTNPNATTDLYGIGETISVGADDLILYAVWEKKEAQKELFVDRNKNEITVYLNGEKLDFDVPPQIINDRTMVPMRKIFEELGAVVGWNNNTQNAIACKKRDIIRISIGDQYMTCNDEQILLDSPAVVISGRTLVPVRAIAESLNCNVEWYGNERVVDITMNIINAMENRSELKIGWSEYASFTYLDEYGNLTGLDIDLAKYVCQFWGWEVYFEEIPFEMALDSIMTGKIDCYWSGVSKTEERAEISTFTNEYISFDMEYEENGEWYTSHEVYSVPFKKEDYDTVQLVNIALEEAQKDSTVENLKYKYGIQ